MKSVIAVNCDTEKHSDIIAHVNKQQNGSQYIRDLIRKDIAQTDIKSIVQQYIREYLNDYRPSSEEQEVSINLDDISDIMNGGGLNG